jgi:hypothetical protein
VPWFRRHAVELGLTYGYRHRHAVSWLENIFEHHLRLLGPDPAHWPTRPGR